MVLQLDPLGLQIEDMFDEGSLFVVIECPVMCNILYRSELLMHAINVYIYIYIHTYSCVYIYTYVQMYVGIHIHINSCKHAEVYIRKYIQVYTHMYTHDSPHHPT